MARAIHKKVRKVTLEDMAKWTRTKNADGSITYEATEPTDVTFEEADGDLQIHEAVGTGKKFTIDGDMVDLWELY